MRQHTVESQQNGQIGDAEYNEFYSEREYAVEPSSAEIAEKQQPERRLHTHTQRAPRLGTVFLIPYAPERKRQTAEVACGKIGSSRNSGAFVKSGRMEC